ncbi:MAG: hypothetical protein HY901_16370 [Deltaproteobacteria bacterium]|nr:hypothetical protein [Deltaproteobacteria bacterium]
MSRKSSFVLLTAYLLGCSGEVPSGDPDATSPADASSTGDAGGVDAAFHPDASVPDSQQQDDADAEVVRDASPGPSDSSWLKADAQSAADATEHAGDAGSPFPDAAPYDPCPAGGLGGHLQLVSAHWAASGAYGDHLGELAEAMSAGHVTPPYLGSLGATSPDVIVDVIWYLFTNRGELAPYLSDNLDRLQRELAGRESRVRAFYVFDEPYLDVHATPRTVLEQGIAALKTRFPNIPAYITFAHHCFDPAVSDSACAALAPGQRGIPANLDWASFDWYSTGTCGSTPATLEEQFDCHVRAGVTRLKALAPNLRLLVTGEGFDLFLPEPNAIEAIHRSFGLGLSEPQVLGVDYFLWASTPRFHGLSELPAARATVRAFGRQVLGACGRPPDSKIPVFEWSRSAVPDFDYRPWYWEGWESSGYSPAGVAFALPPTGTPGTSPLYSCTLERAGGVVDHGYLTRSGTCDGAQLLGAPASIGGIFTSQAADTVPLYRSHYQSPPWDAHYSSSSTPPAGYVSDFQIGWVYPPDAL